MQTLVDLLDQEIASPRKARRAHFTHVPCFEGLGFRSASDKGNPFNSSSLLHMRYTRLHNSACFMFIAHNILLGGALPC